MKHAMQKKIPVLALSLFLVVGCESAIDMSTPSQLNQRQVRVQETMRTEVLSRGELQRAEQIEQITRRHAAYGRGPVTVTVSYMSGSKHGKRAAAAEGDMLRKAFVAKGMKVEAVHTVAVDKENDADRALASWLSLEALPPENCTPMPGTYGAETLEEVAPYPMGCEVHTAWSKMVYDPSDLLGKARTPDEDSSRHGAMVDNYMNGTPNETLEGLSASEISRESVTE
ncbi:MAG: CpaD family pilus assembly lipoprotein [Alphaproteobacteria bacterium]|nr:CpaD family pilus assembly lipoprotein [Alphaproteobacteria bacterium]